MDKETRQYIEYINDTCPNITLREEAGLIELARKGNKEAKDRLVNVCLRRVPELIEKAGVPVDMDTIQEGNLAVLQTLDTFLKGHANPMSCRPSIYMAVQRKVTKLERDRNSAFCLRKETYDRSWRESSIGSPDLYTIVLYEEETGENDSPEWGYGLRLPEEHVLERRCSHAVRAVLRSLTPREQLVLEMRFGLKTGTVMTLKEVADEFGFTREHIRQIEAKALRKLRDPLRSERLRDYMYL